MKVEQFADLKITTTQENQKSQITKSAILLYV